MKFYFLLSRRCFVAIVCAIFLLVLLLGELKAATNEKTKDGADNFSRVNFILSLGYKVKETPVSVKKTVLPQNYFEGFNEYVLMQTNTGFPFEQFKGENIDVFEYTDEEENFITLIVSNGQIIGGHISDGVNHKIKPLEEME